MTLLSDLLDRFRRALVPPGAAAGAAAVPEDRPAALAAEVAPVLDVLGDIEGDARAVEAAASATAGAIRDRAAIESGRIREQAVRRAARARAEAAAGRQAELEALAAERLDLARAEAARIERQGADRTPEVVAAVIRRVRALGQPPP